MSINTPARIPQAPEATPITGYFTPITSSQTETEQAGRSLPLSHYLWILRRNLWKMLAFVASCMVITYIVSVRLTPIYESTAVVDVDRQAPSAVVGQESTRSIASNDSEPFLATQLKLIQSDAVLRPVTQRFDLLEKEKQIDPTNTEHTRRATNAPVLLKRLKVSRPPNTYLLWISYRSPDPQLAADVSNAIAESYLTHSYNIRIRSSASLSSFMEQQMEELKAKMERSVEALVHFERDLNVINPDEKTNILSSRLLQLNTEYTVSQAERVKKEAAWNSIKNGSLEAAQISAQGEALGQVSQKLNESKQRLAEVKTTFGSNHPEFKKAASHLVELQNQFEQSRTNVSGRIEMEFNQAKNREDMLRSAVSETKAEFDKINSRSFEYQQLRREAEADKKLYEELVRKIKEAGINAGFQNNNIRIADFARPSLNSIFPNVRLNLLLAFFISSLIIIAVSILIDTLDTTIRDAEQTRRLLGVEVIGSLPSVKDIATLRMLDDKQGMDASLGALGSAIQKSTRGYRTMSTYEEAIRTLRSSILLSDFDSRLRSILMTSASPSEGKSTTALHLSIANAEQGKRTLLIDADLRRPSIHRKLKLPMHSGLSSVLMGEMHWKNAIVRVPEIPNLDLLLSGPPSHRATDMIGPLLGDMLDEFGKEYELIIIDAPPLLGFSEPLQMAAVADGVLVVSLAGETNRKAVEALLHSLKRLRSNVIGLVLNGVKRNTSEGYHYYNYYNSYKNVTEVEK